MALRRSFPSMMGEFPLEMALSVWGVVSGLTIFAQGPSSIALQSLPIGLQYGWAVLLLISAVTIIAGLWMRRRTIMASGMYLFASTLGAFAAAILGASGWQRGGTTAGLMLALGGVFVLRGFWLTDQEAALVKEIDRSRSTDGPDS